MRRVLLLSLCSLLSLPAWGIIDIADLGGCPPAGIFDSQATPTPGNPHAAFDHFTGGVFELVIGPQNTVGLAGNAAEIQQGRGTYDPVTGMINVNGTGTFAGFNNTSFNVSLMPQPGGTFNATFTFGTMMELPGGATGVWTGTATPKVAGVTDQCTSAGKSNTDPVSTSTGELYSSPDPDLSLGGGPMLVRFRRYYASLLSFNGINSSLGANWMHNYDVRLYVMNSNATVVLFGGRTVRFHQANGKWQLISTERYSDQLLATSGGYQYLSLYANLIYTFDSSGNLTGIQDRNGNKITVTPGPNGPTQVSDGLGRQLTFSYSNGNLVKVSDQTGRSVSFTYSSGALASVTDAGHNTTAYSYAPGAVTGLILNTTKPLSNKDLTQTYDGLARVTKQTDALNNSVTFNYSSTPGATSVTDPLGNTFSNAHSPLTALTQFTDPAGKSGSITYDGGTRPTQLSDRSGGQTKIAYDPLSGYPSSYTDPAGNTTKYEYTAQSQGGFTYYVLGKITYPDGATELMSYDAAGNMTQGTDRSGSTWKFAYNPIGNITSITNPTGGKVSFSYKADGVMSSSTNAGGTTGYIYDALDRLTEIDHPDGSKRTMSYDALDRLTSATDERGMTGSFGYDANGNLIKSTDALNGITSLNFDADDRLTGITDPLGNTSTYGFDAAGRMNTFTNPAGDFVRMAYDAAGRLSSVTDCSSKGPVLTYTAEGIPASLTDQLGRKWTYTSDANGKITKIATPTGQTVSYTYDSSGRRTSFTDALGATVKYTYDARGQLSGISMPGGLATSLERDAQGRITAVVDANGNRWKRGYDADGKLVSETDPLGQTTTYSYDSRLRLSSAKLPSGGTISYSYDATGNMTQIKNPDGSTMNYTYDANGRVTGGTGFTMGYDARGNITSANGLTMKRDAEGRISALTYASGKTVSYGYNCRGLVDKITDWVGGTTALTYNDAGELTTVTRPNGITTTYTYDSEGALASINEPGVASITLTRDAAGNVTAEDRTVSRPAAKAVQRHDDLSTPFIDLTQLPAAQDFGYDGANQFTGLNYDALRNLLQMGPRQFQYDSSGQFLTKVTDQNGTTSLSYDGMGFLAGKTGPDGKPVNFILNYATALPSIAVVQSGSADQTYNVFLPNGIFLYSVDAATNARTFAHFDERGNTTAITDDRGAVMGSFVYSPYGEVASSSGTLPQFGYMGQFGVPQAAPNLYLPHGRPYDAMQTRFVSPKPLTGVTPVSTNQFTVFGADPMPYVDFGVGLTTSYMGDAGKLISSGYKLVRKFDPNDPTDPSFVAAGLSTVFKTADIYYSGVAKAGFERAFDFVESEGGEIGGPALATAIDANKAAQAAQMAKTVGNLISYATAGYSEYKQATKEGNSTTKGLIRVGGRVGAEVFVKTALAEHPVVALVDGATGNNLSNSITQLVRLPGVYTGSGAEQDAYTRAVNNGDYGKVLKFANKAGEIYSDNGVAATWKAAFSGWSWDQFTGLFKSDTPSGPTVPPPAPKGAPAMKPPVKPVIESVKKIR